MERLLVAIEPGAFVPERAHREDAGIDLRSPVECSVIKGNPAIIDTGVHVAIPEGYVGFLKSKSGLNVKHGIRCEGVIDAGYTGAIVVKLYNDSDTPYHVSKGDKIAQLVILPVETPEIEVVGMIRGGERGDNGFGSTGR